MELQSRYADIQAQGLGLIVITHDSLETLRTFSQARGIAFPILSDEGSVVIQEYDLLNREQQTGTRFYGIPYPGTFILDTEGRVTARFFEQAYQERFTVSSIMVALGDPVHGIDRNATRLTTAHLEALVYATDGTVAPGNRFSLVVDVTPKSNMHVYAPGDHPVRSSACASTRRISSRCTMSPIQSLRSITSSRSTSGWRSTSSRSRWYRR
ncbi:MAG: peroxiredoxin family protein [Candidatus Poseidoniales archaeon]|nr:peroxiredoxin family protein [Candidatus Poseidoniales archaeon]